MKRSRKRAAAASRSDGASSKPSAAGPGGTRIVRTRRGLRLVDGRDVLSEVLARPGATHGLFDILAACIAAFDSFDGAGTGAAAAASHQHPRAAMLGFAAGGVVAPLRAMGFTSPLMAVDLSREAEALFRETCGAWAGDVRFVESEASAWLRRQRSRWDVLLEDLTVPHPGGAIKPAVSVEVLPQLMHDRLTSRGVVTTNVLPVPGLSWDALLARLAAPHRHALLVECEDYENRVLLGGPGLPAARQTAASLRAVLRRIGSRQSNRFRVTRFD